MGYSNSYNRGISGIPGAVIDKETQDLIDKGNRCRSFCRGQIQCDPPNRIAYSACEDTPNGMIARCSCKPPVTQTEGGGVRIAPSGGYGNIIRSSGVNGVDGLNESFLESLGSIGNLAIIGLAIYGGFCLAKKL